MVSMTVNDLDASLDWYHRVVGFGIAQKYEHEGVVRTIALSAGNVTILLNQDDGAKGWDRTKGVGLSVGVS
jgi:catechol 2,3-dioxygenase-like lactoylglutathione lyase family enzyme